MRSYRLKRRSRSVRCCRPWGLVGHRHWLSDVVGRGARSPWAGWGWPCNVEAAEVGAGERQASEPTSPARWWLGWATHLWVSQSLSYQGDSSAKSTNIFWELRAQPRGEMVVVKPSPWCCFWEETGGLCAWLWCFVLKREKPTFSFCFPSDGEVMPITHLFCCLAQSKASWDSLLLSLFLASCRSLTTLGPSFEFLL